MFDATSEPDRPGGSKEPTGPAPFLGIQFECCGVYGRIYRDRSEPVYSGRCPKCMRCIRVPIGDDGTGQRFFRAR